MVVQWYENGFHKREVLLNNLIQQQLDRIPAHSNIRHTVCNGVTDKRFKVSRRQIRYSSYLKDKRHNNSPRSYGRETVV